MLKCKIICSKTVSPPFHLRCSSTACPFRQLFVPLPTLKYVHFMKHVIRSQHPCYKIAGAAVEAARKTKQAVSEAGNKAKPATSKKPKSNKSNK